MAARKKDEGHPPPPVVRYAPLGELKVYLIQEHELDQLAAGSPSSIQFNFAVFLFPIGATLIFTLATTEIKSDRLYQSLVAVASVTIIISALLFLLWLRNYRTSINLVAQIKDRMPIPEPIERSAVEPSEVSETAAQRPATAADPERRSVERGKPEVPPQHASD